MINITADYNKHLHKSSSTVTLTRHRPTAKKHKKTQMLSKNMLRLLRSPDTTRSTLPAMLTDTPARFRAQNSIAMLSQLSISRKIISMRGDDEKGRNFGECHTHLSIARLMYNGGLTRPAISCLSHRLPRQSRWNFLNPYYRKESLSLWCS